MAWLAVAAVIGLLGSAHGASPPPTTSLPAPIRVPGAKGPAVHVTCGSLQHALDRLRAGQTVVVHGGPCSGQYNVVGKTLSRPAEIRGARGAGVVFTGAPYKGYPSLYVAKSSNVVLGRNLEVVNPVGPCIVIETSRNVRVLGARIHSCGGQGILVKSGDASTSTVNVQLDRNEIWNVGSAEAGLDRATGNDGSEVGDSGYWRYGTHAIYFGAGRGVTLGGGVWNNYIHDQPTGYGIQVGGGAQGSIIAANTIRRVTRDPRRDEPPTSVSRAGACIQLFSSFAGSRDVIIANNVCTDAATRGIAGSCSCTGIGVVSSNVIWRNGVAPAIAANYGSSTVFVVARNWTVNPRLGDHSRPQAGSPLIGRADPRFLPRVDFHGTLRKTRTIGAFEAAR